MTAYDAAKNGVGCYAHAIASLHERLWNGFRPELSYAVASTIARREVMAAADLVQRGFNVYLPMWTSRTGKREPAFPGYVFVDIQSTAGRPQDVGAVSHLLLTASGVPGQISGVDLQSLREDELAGRLQERAKKQSNDPHGVLDMPTGAPLEATEGPFVGFPCELESTDGLERCKVLFDIFGRSTAVDMPLDQVRAVG